MMDFLMEYQISILTGCGLVCALLAVFVMNMNFHSVAKKMTLAKLETSLALMLIFEGTAYLYDGAADTFGFWMVRISDFMVYCLLLTSVYYLYRYVIALYMDTGKFDDLPRRLKIGTIIPIIGIVLVVVSQFTGIYYYFDENSVYHRGTFYWIGFILPFATVNMLFTFVWQHRKDINKRIVASILMFSVLPIVAALLQLFFYGFSFIDMASWISAVTLFIFALGDQNDELARAANIEALTGLPNTFGYQYEVDRIVHTGDITEYCAFYFDIVRMNVINNKYGKKNGDVVIVKYAEYIHKTLEEEEILGRLGGNFFVALIKKPHVEKFLKMLADVPVEIDYGGHTETIHISAIAGGYEINRKNINSGQILTYISTATAYAKNTVHKPYVFMDEQLEKEFHFRRMMEYKTKAALENDEFEPFYQPKVDTQNNTLCGAEALVRWRRDGEIVSPAEFIPVMENNGSICDLDFYVLECVCKDVRGWLDAGIEPVPISVNFSRRNLGNPVLSEAISKVVEKNNVPKDLIQIEVTETLDEYPKSYLIGVVEALQRYGIKTAIDDFGTGSSSLWLLKDVKFDVLKIDKSFVDYRNELDKELLHDIICMAKKRDIEVLAEGVEEYDKVSELKNMGCSIIQGYVFDKPLEKSAFEERLTCRSYSAD